MPEAAPPAAQAPGTGTETMDGQFHQGDFAHRFIHHHDRPRGGLSAHPALVLNADYRPLSYLPLSLWTWQEAIKAAFADRVDVVAEYEAEVHSPSISMKIPSVVVLKDYVKPARSAAFTRFNLFLRDAFTCQYCGSRRDLTFDHVIPRALGGRTVWENVVAACASCNLKKGARPLEQTGMRLMRKPRRPTGEELRNIGRRFPPNHLHESWMDFLYWDVELSP